MGHGAVRIDTLRLRLRSLTPADREDIFRSFTPAVTRYMSPPTARRIEETDAFLASAGERMVRGTDLVCAVLREDDERFLGCVGAHELDTGRPELGIWIREDAWGEGYGLEAVTHVHRWASGIVDADAFVYPVDERNGPSRRIAEQLGGRVVRGPESEPTADGRTLRLLRYQVPAAFPHLSSRLRRYAMARGGIGAMDALEAAALDGVHENQDRERILTAILLVAGEDLSRLEDAVQLARTDWRDVLLNAGLAAPDWPDRIDAALG